MMAIRAALDAARVVFDHAESAMPTHVWSAAQRLLRTVLMRPELGGHALVVEARSREVITSSDADALVALNALADRADGPVTSEADSHILRTSWMAIDHAAATQIAVLRAQAAAATALGAPPQPVSSFAPPAAGAAAGLASGSARSASAWSPPPAPAARSFANSLPGTVESVAPASKVDLSPGGPFTVKAKIPARPRRTLVIALVLLTLLIIVAAVWFTTRGRSDANYTEGVAAYSRGAREVARTAFARAAQQAPTDARPLIFLGRLAREEGDMPGARRFLDAAVRVEPSNALAARELAAALLADRQPELARRFYVRALQLDPTDRVAQGFLGCALLQLRRVEEAQRWFTRAGPGDWSACVPPTPSLP